MTARQGGFVKRKEARRSSVCIVCGEPSKQRICETCKIKVEAEAIQQKLQTAKSGKRSD